MRRSPDFFVDEKIEKGQKGERYDVHEDKIEPSHVDLYKEEKIIMIKDYNAAI